jgi:hypothetical protein
VPLPGRFGDYSLGATLGEKSKNGPSRFPEKLGCDLKMKVLITIPDQQVEWECIKRSCQKQPRLRLDRHPRDFRDL